MTRYIRKVKHSEKFNYTTRINFSWTKSSLVIKFFVWRNIKTKLSECKPKKNKSTIAKQAPKKLKLWSARPQCKVQNDRTLRVPTFAVEISVRTRNWRLYSNISGARLSRKLGFRRCIKDFWLMNSANCSGLPPSRYTKECSDTARLFQESAWNNLMDLAICYWLRMGIIAIKNMHG